MGIDLKLMPYDDIHDDSNSSNTILSCDRWSILFERINEIKSYSCNPEFQGFLSYDFENKRHCYGKIMEDNYGNDLMYIMARDLYKLRTHPGVRENTRNRVIWAYICELAPDNKIALYWD